AARSITSSIQTARTPFVEKRSYALARIRSRAIGSALIPLYSNPEMDRPVFSLQPPVASDLPGVQPVCDADADEHRDLLLPRLKRVRPPGRESRGRVERPGLRRNDRSRAVRTVRRP